MAQGKVSGMAANGTVRSTSPGTATIWLAAAGVGALGFLAFSELYAWIVPVVLALIGWAAAALVSAGKHRAALALACVFVVAVLFPMIGALAFSFGPFLNSIQSGEATFVSFIETAFDLLVAGAVAVFCAVMALRSFPSDIVEKYFSYGIVSTPRFIIGSLILAGIAINFANVLGRYLFLAPIIWAEEIMIYIMVWMVFVGSVLVTWDGHHLKMDFFSIMLPSPAKEIMNFVGVVGVHRRLPVRPAADPHGDQPDERPRPAQRRCGDPDGGPAFRAAARLLDHLRRGSLPVPPNGNRRPDERGRRTGRRHRGGGRQGLSTGRPAVPPDRTTKDVRTQVSGR